jgi:hypothetical protein
MSTRRDHMCTTVVAQSVYDVINVSKQVSSDIVVDSFSCDSAKCSLKTSTLSEPSSQLNSENRIYTLLIMFRLSTCLSSFPSLRKPSVRQREYFPLREKRLQQLSFSCQQILCTAFVLLAVKAFSLLSKPLMCFNTDSALGPQTLCANEAAAPRPPTKTKCLGPDTKSKGRPVRSRAMTKMHCSLGAISGLSTDISLRPATIVRAIPARTTTTSTSEQPPPS